MADAACRRFRASVAVAAAITLGLTALGRVRAASALSYVALGDSIAVGTGDAGGGGYVARYQADAAADLGVPVDLQNLAVGGSTSADLLTALDTDSALGSAVAGADLVTVDIGGNDLLIALFAFKSGTCGGSDGEDCLRQAVTTFATNWSGILDALRALNPGAMMRAMTYYNPLITDLEPGDGTAAALKPHANALNATIRSTSPTHGVAVAEGAIAFNGRKGTADPVLRGFIDVDHIHPSPLGYDALAEAFHALGYAPVPGTLVRVPSTIVLKDDVVPPFDPTRRKLSFVSSTSRGQGPANRVVLPPVGGPQDPRTAGATLEVSNATGQTADHVVVPLPAAGWSLSGAGFRFVGTGPVTQALLLPNKLKVKAHAPGFDYTLDETSQGSIAVRLTLAGGSWCAVGPAKPTGVPPSPAASDLPGRFVGERNAPAPASCP